MIERTMEHSMKLVEEHCGKYLQMFGECIQQFPHTWQMDCEPLRKKLSKCAETNPEIVHIKKSCADEFLVYEQCMRENQTDTDKCSGLFSAFSTCADRALDSFKPEKLSGQKAAGPPALIAGTTEDKR